MACNLSKENLVETIISKCAQEATGKALNAFELLMTRGRAFVAPKETRLCASTIFTLIAGFQFSIN